MSIVRRSPALVLACGAGILMLALGIRQSFGLFLQPMTQDLGWGREAFAFAIAVQNLIWGLAQPFAGMVADRWGAGRVLAISGLLYAAGLGWMAGVDTVIAFDLSAGLLIGFGLSGTSFGVVMGVVGRSFEPRTRSLALGVVGAGGSFGQFAMLPFGQGLITAFGWQGALLVLAVTSALIVPLGAALAGRAGAPARMQSLGAALQEAGGHRGFWFLTLSFTVCGFQTIFIMLHLPAYLVDHGLSASTGMTALALVGLFNIVGSYACGALGGRYSKKNLLAGIYTVRAVAISAFLAVPVTAVSAGIFASVMGLTWLGTVPLTNAMVAQIFGVQYLSTLFGLVFLGHQVGSFLGAWYGGRIFDLTGSYQTVWLIAIGLSVVAALLCVPINERPLAPAIPGIAEP